MYYTGYEQMVNLSLHNLAKNIKQKNIKSTKAKNCLKKCGRIIMAIYLLLHSFVAFFCHERRKKHIQRVF